MSSHHTLGMSSDHTGRMRRKDAVPHNLDESSMSRMDEPIDMALKLFLLAAVLAGAVSAASPPPPPPITATATASPLPPPPPPNSTDAASFCPATSHQCGDRVEIRYPFWVDSNLSTCGYGSLRLDCRGGTPVLVLPSGEYGVTSIRYGADDRTIDMFDLGVARNNSCPNVAGLKNLTLPAGSRLSLTDRDTTLRFFVGCNFTGPTEATRVPCLLSADGRRNTYVLRDDDDDGDIMPFASSTLCEDVVQQPVLRRSLPSSTDSLLDAVMPALKKGFELRWMPAAGGECGKCEKGGGLCGVQAGHENAFKCFTAAPAPKSSGGRRLSPRTIVWFVLTGLTLLGALVAILLIYWGKCKAQAAVHGPEAGDVQLT